MFLRITCPLARLLLTHEGMKTYAIFALALFFCVKIYALDLNAEGKKALGGLSKALQKSKIIKTGPRLFNRKVTDANRPKPGEFWIGIVGDSSTTGAAASPHFHATWASMFDNTVGNMEPSEPLPPPIRVMYTTSEFKKADHEGQAMELNIQSGLSQKIDTEEYSFGYILGKKIGLSPDRIVLAGQDGTRISSLFTQFERLLAVGSPGLPPLILVSYVANDLCPSDNFSNPVDRFRERYTSDLQKQFEQIAHLQASPNGTRVVFVAPLDIGNVLSNANLLSQKIRIESHRDVTCQQLRDNAVGGNDFTKLMQNTLRGECRGLFAQSNNPAQKLAQVRALQEAQTAALTESIDQFNARNLPIKMQYAASAKQIDFQAGDLANDCFHPGKTGAERIADQLLTNELSDLKP